MYEERYSLEASFDLTTFEFTSVGPKGKIEKVVVYSEINLKNVFNLAFGDKDPITGYLNDLSVTNNGDSQKVLATVATTLYAFINEYPHASVIATGSTLARTRLYRMGISNHLTTIEKDFEIYGLTEHKNWEEFRKNKVYGAFLVRRKL
jgi:hypothetical protein